MPDDAGVDPEPDDAALPALRALVLRLGALVRGLAREAVERERERGPHKVMTGLIVEGRQPLRDGGEVWVGAVNVGTLTSGNFSPVLERGIGLGLLQGDLESGAPVTVALRGREIAACVTALPFVRKAK